MASDDEDGAVDGGALVAGGPDDPCAPAAGAADCGGEAVAIDAEASPAGAEPPEGVDVPADGGLAPLEELPTAGALPVGDEPATDGVFDAGGVAAADGAGAEDAGVPVAGPADAGLAAGG